MGLVFGDEGRCTGQESTHAHIAIKIHSCRLYAALNGTRASGATSTSMV